jgi:hypothetical protein
MPFHGPIALQLGSAYINAVSAHVGLIEVWPDVLKKQTKNNQLLSPTLESFKAFFVIIFYSNSQ